MIEDKFGKLGCKWNIDMIQDDLKAYSVILVKKIQYPTFHCSLTLSKKHAILKYTIFILSLKSGQQFSTKKMEDKFTKLGCKWKIVIKQENLNAFSVVFALICILHIIFGISYFK